MLIKNILTIILTSLILFTSCKKKSNETTFSLTGQTIKQLLKTIDKLLTNY